MYMKKKDQPKFNSQYFWITEAMFCARDSSCWDFIYQSHATKLLLVVGNDVRFVSFVVVGFLSPANKVCEGYVFTGVCLSTGRVSAPLHAGIHTPWTDMPWAHTPLGTHPPGRLPWADTPQADCPGHTPPGQTPPLHSACWDTVNKWAVRIPLECILVFSAVVQ